MFAFVVSAVALLAAIVPQPLYSDEEAVVFQKRAADFMSGKGEVRTKGWTEVLATLKVDPRRLKFQESHIGNATFWDVWQISESYQLTYAYYGPGEGDLCLGVTVKKIAK